MAVLAALLAWGALAACTSAALHGGEAEPAHKQFAAFEQVRFSSLDTGGRVSLDGYLFRPAVDGPRPALVLLHGCGGVVTTRGVIHRSTMDWANRLAEAGYVVLVVDSFTPRGVRNMCAPSNFQAAVARARPADAYGALRYLQAQPFVRPDEIGLIGWSQGGGSVLRTVSAHDNEGRPANLPQGDFRAAVAFYPGGCNERRLGPGWSTTIPLLVLTGEKDVWTPAEPCQVAMGGAASRGAPVDIHIYPGAYHAFDTYGIVLHEEPGYRTSAGVVPILGTDPAGRDDALTRVPAFLGRHLGG